MIAARLDSFENSMEGPQDQHTLRIAEVSVDAQNRRKKVNEVWVAADIGREVRLSSREC